MIVDGDDEDRCFESSSKQQSKRNSITHSMVEPILQLKINILFSASRVSVRVKGQISTVLKRKAGKTTWARRGWTEKLLKRCQERQSTNEGRGEVMSIEE